MQRETDKCRSELEKRKHRDTCRLVRTDHLTCFVHHDFDMAAFGRRSDGNDTSVVCIAEVADDAVVVFMSIEDLVHEIDARAVVDRFMVTFFGRWLKPQFEAHL
jgi:hypothetical protein